MPRLDLLNGLNFQVQQVFENQRKFSESSAAPKFTALGLCDADPNKWSKADTGEPLTAPSTFPLPEFFSVLSEWTYVVNDGTEAGGWMYAPAFDSTHWYPAEKNGCEVRRRCWQRVVIQREQREEALAILASSSQKTVSHEGKLIKRGHVRTNWKERYFVLGDGRLDYYSRKPANDSERAQFHKGGITLTNSTVMTVPRFKFHKSEVFEVNTRNNVLYMQAHSLEEMETWMRMIQKEITTLRERNNSFLPLSTLSVLSDDNMQLSSVAVLNSGDEQAKGVSRDQGEGRTGSTTIIPSFSSPTSVDQDEKGSQFSSFSSSNPARAAGQLIDPATPSTLPLSPSGSTPLSKTTTPSAFGVQESSKTSDQTDAYNRGQIFASQPPEEKSQALQIEAVNTEDSKMVEAVLDSDMSNSPAVVGASVLKKMSSESRYRRRFVWVDVKSRTFHWSKTEGRDGVHKQIFLADVKCIGIGRPKRSTSSAKDARCISLEMNGGAESIDLMLPTSELRDEWVRVLEYARQKN